MGKKINKQIFKWLAPLSLGVILLGGGLLSDRSLTLANTSYVVDNTPIALRASHTSISIKDEKLATALRTLLGKSAKDNFYADDFVNHPTFKAVTVTDEETGISTTTAGTYQLDLSNTGITNISELCQFEFPETLQGINLCGNGITYEHLSQITQLISSTTSSVIVNGDDVLTPACDFLSIIKKVNLNNNNIDLTHVNISDYLNNEKLLFGIQNFGDIHSSGLVRKGEIEPMYYIRSTSDANYLSFTFLYQGDNTISTDKTYDTPTKLLTNGNGKVSITVASLPNSSSAYFSGYFFTREFRVFDIQMQDGYTVERKSLLNLDIVDGVMGNDCPLIVQGLGTNYTISYNNASTSRASSSDYTNYVYVTLNCDNASRTVPVEFTVVDTIYPKIELKGGSHVYSCKNKEFNEPGYIAYDPVTIGAEEGDDLTNRVRTESTIVISQLGSYIVTYTVTDLAGNTTTITRIVDIEEAVLDRIDVRTNTDNLLEGENIILVVKPDADVDINKYSSITYEWYLNGNLFITTLGDKATGKSTTTVNISSSGVNEISVIVKATQLSNGEQIEVYSNTLQLNIQSKLRNNDTLILALAISIVVIIILIGIVALTKYYRGRGKIHGRHKNFHKGKSKNSTQTSNPQIEIQVIKNYNGTPNGGNAGSGEGGGNSNFRLPENSNNSSNNNDMNK